MPENSRLNDDSAPDYSTVLADLNRLPEKAAKNLSSAFALLTEQAANTLGVSRANIWLYSDEKRDTLRCIDAYQLATKTHTEGATLDAAMFPRYFAALSQERVIAAHDAATHPATSEFAAEYLPENNIKSMLDAPIRQDGEVVGVICLEQESRTRQWTEDEGSFVATLSDFATIALLSHRKDLAETALIQSQKMESLGRLAGGIAHDFNNILTVINGAVETLQLEQSDPEHTRRMLGLIADAGQRARDLTRSLLAFGGHQNLAFAPISTHQFLSDVQNLTQTIIREDISLEFRSGSTEYWTNGDQAQLEQVLLNLMINSVDAMPNGGQLIIEALGPDRHGMIGFAVTDSGSGMSEQIIDQIFEPFFSTKGDLGSGLGLSTSLGIVRQHGGELTCRFSTPGGTRFELRLPRTTGDEVETIEQEHYDPGNEEEGQRLRILLVEDESSVRDIVKQMLKAIGFDTLVADDARHALQILADEDVDLLVSDVVMPDLRGPELYQEARKIKSDLSVLFVSGYSEEVISQVQSGGNQVAFLSKPFTLAQLRQALMELVEASNLKSKQNS